MAEEKKTTISLGALLGSLGGSAAGSRLGNAAAVSMTQDKVGKELGNLVHTGRPLMGSRALRRLMPGNKKATAGAGERLISAANKQNLLRKLLGRSGLVAGALGGAALGAKLLD